MTRLDPDALDAAATAAENAADLDSVGEYGYGGEVFDRYVVSNWQEVAEAAVRAYMASAREQE